MNMWADARRYTIEQSTSESDFCLVVNSLKNIETRQAFIVFLYTLRLHGKFSYFYFSNLYVKINKK